MILKGDASALEWRTKAFLAQDQVAIAELNDPSKDIHQENVDVFKLPTRTVAKNFLYRMIFADAFGDKGLKGPAFAYVNDPNFSPTSRSVAFWEGVIERFFTKYSGIYSHSVGLIREAVETGRVLSPSGREYPYKQFTGRGGEPRWPNTQILNHIVQGFSADIMIFVRLHLYQNWNPEWGVLINTVHDDCEADVKNDCGTILQACCLIEECFPQMNVGCKKWYGVELNVPMLGEAKLGMSLHEDSMIKFRDKQGNIQEQQIKEELEKVWQRRSNSVS